MRLLERDVPLATLDRLRAESVSDGGRLVFIEGEAGVGKTSLLRAFRDSVPSEVLTMLGSCDPMSTPPPLGPFVDIAAELDPAIERLIEEGGQRSKVFKAVLAALRRSDGIVVLLEDLHWADEATLDLLRFAGRRIESTRALVVGTYREDEVGRQHPLRVVVGELATSPAVRRLPLHSLSVASVRELARGTDLDSAELHRRTGGNPFYVTEVIASAPALIPPTVRDAVLARIARLSPHGRRTLEAAAVIGPTVDPAMLTSVIDDPAAEECLAKGLLQSDGQLYRFRHEIARQAVLDATDPVVRRAVHARVLEALEREGADDRYLALLAHHAAEAGSRDAVLRYAPQAAAQAAAAGAHREAAAQLARVEPHADRLPERERATFFENLAREQFLTASYDLGLGAYEAAIAIWHGLGDARHEVMALIEVSRTLTATARSADAAAALRRAADIGDDLPDGAAKSETLTALALYYLVRREFAEAIEAGRLAIRMAAADVGSMPSVVLTWDTIGTARILSGDLGGTADLERSIELAREHGLDRNGARAYVQLVDSLAETYRFSHAEPYIDAGRRFMTERELDAQRLYLESQLALSELHRGRWSEAGALALSILSQPSNSVISRIAASVALGRLRARRGDPDAWPALDTALALAEPSSSSPQMVRAARAELGSLEGDVSRSGTEAAAGLDAAVRERQPWQIGELAWWLVQAGVSVPDQPGAAEPWRLQLAGRPREAADAWLALDCPYEAARALLESSDVVHVEEAHATFDRLGARPATTLAVRRLRELGARSIPRGARPTTRANPLGLTARELEILHLVARGRSNQEIADVLVLSRRTVHHHVAAVLGKLGVSRRGDVAAAAVKAGIDAQHGHADGTS